MEDKIKELEKKIEFLTANCKLPPFKLIIETDSYTGNFEREFISYVFGTLGEREQEGYSIYSEAMMSEEDLSEDDIEIFAGEYLFHSYEWVDDCKMETFFNICNYKDGIGTTGIEVYLNKQLCGKDILRYYKRIIKFFKEGIAKTKAKLISIENVNIFNQSTTTLERIKE